MVNESERLENEEDYRLAYGHLQSTMIGSNSALTKKDITGGTLSGEIRKNQKFLWSMPKLGPNRALEIIRRYLVGLSLLNREVEQMVARLAHNQQVAGSNPALATKFIMETIKMIWKSKINVCMASPPRTLHVHRYNDKTGEEIHFVLGNVTLNCPYCGKPWNKH